jgi:thiosulfate/3-mercaptopyruvate sulfurtransferase
MSAFEHPDDPLVSAEWLADHLEAPEVRVFDATWLLFPEGRTPAKEHSEKRIPGSFFFDIDEIKDSANPLPHMLPSPEKFASRMRAFGIGDGMRIVIYDTVNVVSAARAWWMFRVMGHEDVVVLNGGFKKWLAEGRPTESGPVKTEPRHFTARLRDDLVADIDRMKIWSAKGGRQIADARSPERFRGESPEPRPGMRAGHIPGARNLFVNTLLDADGAMKDKAGLKAAFAAAGIDPAKPLAASCGSGISACAIALAAARLGHWDVAVYDGSWSEWGSRSDTPIATGA